MAISVEAKCLIMSNDASNASNLKALVQRSGIEAANIWMDDDPNCFMDILSRNAIDFIVIDWQQDDRVKKNIYRRVAEEDRLKQYRILLIVHKLESFDRKTLQQLSRADYLLYPYELRPFKSKVKDLFDTESNSDLTVFRHLEFHLKSGDIAAAETLCIQHLKENSNDAFAHVYRGRIYEKRKDNDHAVESYYRALALQNDLIEAKERLGHLFLEIGNHVKAEELLKHVPAYGQRETARKVAIGQSRLASGDIEGAREMLAGIDVVDATNSSLSELKGLISFHDGDFEAAKSLLKDLDSTEHLAKHFNSMAIACIKEKQFAEGLKIYRNALDVMPDRSRHHLLYYNMGLAYLRWKKSDKAEVLFIKALKIKPGYAKAKHYLEEIRKTRRK